VAAIYFWEGNTMIELGSGAMSSYRDLVAWKKGMRLALDVYRATKSFPREELYGLTSQLRRAAVSIPSNIAEGQARFSHKEFHHFLGNAKGSLAEIDTQILLAQELQLLAEDDARGLLHQTDELGRILSGLRSSIHERISN
jgi:four helix bundle protein